MDNGSKKYVNITLWIFFNLAVVSCNWGPVEAISYSAIIYYRDIQGQDLLNPVNPGQYDPDSISVSWVNNNGSKGSQPIKVYNYTFNSAIPYLPGGHSISIGPGSYKDNNGNNGIVNGNQAIVFIRLNKLDTDTITFDYSRTGLNKIIYNKTLINPPSLMHSYPSACPVVIIK